MKSELILHFLAVLGWNEIHLAKKLITETLQRQKCFMSH